MAQTAMRVAEETKEEALPDFMGEARASQAARAFVMALNTCKVSIVLCLVCETGLEVECALGSAVVDAGGAGWVSNCWTDRTK